MFSPYYAHARRRGAAEPTQHCALNVALYGPQRRWCMTERGSASLQRSANTLQIGPSRLELQGDRLRIDFDEVAVPFPRRLRGHIDVALPSLLTPRYALDAAARHHWRPLAPQAVVEVHGDAPALYWRGSGYLDTNHGDRPLADDFAGWNWSRARLPEGGSAVLYDVERRDGSALALALQVGADGAQPIPPPPRAALPASRWGIARTTRSDGAAQVRQTLEDGPFYARSLVDARWLGQPVLAVHESLSLDRFERRWVQALLPFRMPRALR